MLTAKLCNTGTVKQFSYVFISTNFLKNTVVISNKDDSFDAFPLGAETTTASPSWLFLVLQPWHHPKLKQILAGYEPKQWFPAVHTHQSTASFSRLHLELLSQVLMYLDQPKVGTNGKGDIPCFQQKPYRTGCWTFHCLDLQPTQKKTIDSIEFASTKNEHKGGLPQTKYQKISNKQNQKPKTNNKKQK